MYFIRADQREKYINYNVNWIHKKVSIKNDQHQDNKAVNSEEGMKLKGKHCRLPSACVCGTADIHSIKTFVSDSALDVHILPQRNLVFLAEAFTVHKMTRTNGLFLNPFHFLKLAGIT